MSKIIKKILAIPGSNRIHSTHLNLIRTITTLAEGKFDVIEYNTIGGLPHFNPDIDNGSSPQPVIEFRRQLQAVDGVLICTPEYAMGVPGTLKNALDWTVSSADFYRKPVSLITASSVGQKGHAALMETLNIIGSVITAETQLIIPFIKTKIGSDGTILDPETEHKVKTLVDKFTILLNSSNGVM
ncbi:MAG: NADPH-dependent FMN reductase [Bacteroidota bacterium]